MKTVMVKNGRTSRCKLFDFSAPVSQLRKVVSEFVDVEKYNHFVQFYLNDYAHSILSGCNCKGGLFE